MRLGVHDSPIDEQNGVGVRHLGNVDEDLLHSHLQLHEAFKETNLLGHGLGVCDGDAAFAKDGGGIGYLQHSETHLVEDEG